MFKKVVLIILLLICINPVFVEAKSGYLYDVLKDEAESGGLAKEYTGEHHDSFTEEPTHKIYHWYAENDDEGNQVLEKNNVIFAGQCWQMIRTTDTGGVKMIYNGVPNEGKCNNIGDSTQIGSSKFNNLSNSPVYVGYQYASVDSKNYISSWMDNVSFGSSVVWNGSSYTLNDSKPITIGPDFYGADLFNYLSYHHYFCVSNKDYPVINQTNCSSIGYLYYYNATSRQIYYYILKNGKNSFDSDISIMLKSNSNDSTIKKYIEEWYESNMIDYKKYIEDVIYCNDRTISSYAGWKSTGQVNVELSFIESTRFSDLSCKNETDKFSISNANAKLKYPVGLARGRELLLLNNSQIYKTGKAYWLISPAGLHYAYSQIQEVGELGAIQNTNSNYEFGVRPVISLMPEIKYNAGIGEKNNPYIIDTRTNFIIDVEINNETEDLTVEISDMTQVSYEEEVTFKVTPIKGFKIKTIKIVDSNNNEIDYSETENKNEYRFIMPASDVTIIPSYERVSNAINIEENKNTKEIKIEVGNATAVVYEDKVKFTVTPEEGYEVDTIEIKDSEGNKVEYQKTEKENEYEFIMPDSDVIIQPLFKKIADPNYITNPETGSNCLFIVFIIIIIFTIKITKRKRLILFK